ncbi:MAG: ZIP family metal transporter [Acidilobaceae archaeon]|nr:ZIP family metal transporter [Acidilobaceae archaeon]
MATLGTTLGAMLVLIPHLSRGERREVLVDVGLAFGSGVMTVASFVSLLLPSLERGGLAASLVAFLLGAAAVAALNEAIPHEHLFKGFEGPPEMKRKIKAAWLVALSIIIHNIPEGYSIGVASAHSPRDGVEVAIAIAMQDMPEGFAVAFPLMALTGSALTAIFISFLSGLSELLAALLAALLLSDASWALPFALSSAAGAMIYVVSHEALPESHRSGREKQATLGFFLGFVLMLVLESSL